MIRRAQAEALLKLAEALEECERNGLTFGMFYTECLSVFQDRRELIDLWGVNGPELRMAIAKLYPKSEAAE